MNLQEVMMGTTEQQAALDREFVEDFAHRYEEAWAERDPERVASMCTEDVVWEDPAVPEALHGRDAVRRFVAATFRMVPDIGFETIGAPAASALDPTIFTAYRMSGTMTGPWEYLDLAPTGRRFTVDGVDRWEIRGGLIAHYRTYYDSLDMTRQLGVLPAQGSRAQRAGTRLQHVQARFQRRSAR